MKNNIFYYNSTVNNIQTLYNEKSNVLVKINSLILAIKVVLSYIKRKCIILLCNKNILCTNK